MSTPHHFLDEWIAPVLRRIPEMAPAPIEDIRSRRVESLWRGLKDAKWLNEQKFKEALQAHYQIGMVTSQDRVDRMTLGLVPEKICRRHMALPLRADDQSISVAMLNPLNEHAMEDIRVVSGRRVLPLFAPLERIEALIKSAFDTDSVMGHLLEQLPEQHLIEVLLDNETEQNANGSKQPAPVVQFVNRVIAQALEQQASDIHIEHQERSSVIRYRIDGVLRHALVLPTHLAAGPVVSRIKVMASLDLANHFQPQDGRIRLRFEGHEIVLRVSVMPTNLGEKIVMRILDRRVATLPFESLGFNPSIAKRLERLLIREEGMMLITGPTGSGKTTTLYSILNRLRTEGTNIVTVEDPIEYKLDGINQVQVNEAQGLPFPAVIRSVLRQDPDIILVGEIRDLETAQASIRASMTGHFVLSTLHTNDSISAVTRLQDIGLERFKISSSLIAVSAQRLVRKLCMECRIPIKTADVEPRLLDELERLKPGGPWYGPKGCKACFFSGYKGRFPIMELFELDDELRQAVSQGVDERHLRDMALRKGMLELLSIDAWWHVAQGRTSIIEALPFLHFHSPPVVTDLPKVKMMSDVQKPIPTEDSLRVPDEPATATPLPTPASSLESRQSLKVLVADDDSVTRTLIRACLTQAHYDVEEAVHGIEVLERVAVRPPDLLILDLQMPQASGHEVLRGIRQIIGLESLPILVLTSRNDAESKQKTLSLGANDYLTKPFRGEALLERMSALLLRSRQSDIQPV